MTCASSLCAYSFSATVRFSLSYVITLSHQFLLLGTVISFQSKPNFYLTEPIVARIRQRDTTLRTTADPSLLVESLLDLGGSLTFLTPGLISFDVTAVVDGALEVVDEYHARLSLLEQQILIKSKVPTVRSRAHSYLSIRQPKLMPITSPYPLWRSNFA